MMPLRVNIVPVMSPKQTVLAAIMLTVTYGTVPPIVHLAPSS